MCKVEGRGNSSRRSLEICKASKSTLTLCSSSRQLRGVLTCPSRNHKHIRIATANVIKESNIDKIRNTKNTQQEGEENRFRLTTHQGAKWLVKKFQDLEELIPNCKTNLRLDRSSIRISSPRFPLEKI